MASKEHLRFTQDFQIVELKEEKIFPVQESDWNELKRDIDNSRNNKTSFLSRIDWGQLLIGAFLSSFFSLIALYNSDDIKSWLYITNWVITISTFFIGIGFLYFNKEKEEAKNIYLDKAGDKILAIERKHNHTES